MSLVVAGPAIGLLTALVLGALEDGGKMFSGMMTVVVAISGLLVLVLGLSPFAIMAFYPADGFAAFTPSPDEGAAPGPASPSRPAGDDEADDEFADESGEFEDDEFDDGGFDDGGFDDDADEELYEDDGEFEDDEEDWG